MYIRSAYLAVLIIVLLAALLPTQATGQSYRDLAKAGATAFEYVAYLQVGLICLLAPVFMASAIAQESNPKTWDILLTTPLSSMQLVLGNLFGRLFFVLALLFASLPLFAITQYFGGVPGRAVLASYAVSACAALLVGAVAVALAVNRLAGKRAVFTFYISVITYLAITLAIDLKIRAGAVTVMTPLNPFLALQALLSPASYPTPDEITLGGMSKLTRMWFGRPVLTWCLLSGGLSAMLITVSATTVRSVGTKSAVPLHRRLFGLGAKGGKSRPPRTVWNNPIAWREAAARAATLPKVLMRWAFITFGVLWGLGLVLYFHNNTAMSLLDFRFMIIATVWTEVIVIVLIALNMSATAISREREDGTLDILLTTPLTPKAYLGGKLRGLIHFFLPLVAVPTLTIAAAGIYVALDGFGRAGGVTVLPVGTMVMVSAPVILPEAAILFPLAFVPFLAFCMMIGLHWSLRTKGTIASVISSVALVGVLTGVIGLCGWQAGAGVPMLGPVLASLTPVTQVWALVQPTVAMESTVTMSAGLAAGRFSLVLGAIASVGVYAAIVYAMRSSMVRTFDTATRKLAGTA